MLSTQQRTRIKRHRKELGLDPKVLNLNAGSISPSPKSLLGVAQKYRQHLAADPLGFEAKVFPVKIQQSRAQLARYLKSDAKDLFFFCNTTTALNNVLRSIKIEEGSEILLSDQEYGALEFCLEDLAARQNLRLKKFHVPTADECDSNEDFERRLFRNIDEQITIRTKVLFFSHILATTGTILPAKKIVAVAKARGLLTLVDGAHAPGAIDLDLPEIDADFYAGNLHKWFMAPTGSAFLRMNPAVRKLVKPLVVSWGWKFEMDKADEGSGLFWGSRIQQAYEFQGTQDNIPYLLVPEILAFRKALGEKTIHARVNELSEFARNLFVSEGLVLATPKTTKLLGPLSAFYFPKVDRHKLRAQFFNKHKMHTLFTARDEQIFFRISAAWFVEEAAIKKLADLMRKNRLLP